MQELAVENMFRNSFKRVKCFKGLFTHDISNLFHVLGNSIELCEILLKQGIKTEEVLKYFKMIAEQINRGKKLVRNVMKLSELEDHETFIEPVDLMEHLENAAQFIKIIFPDRSINIKLPPESRDTCVFANELLLDVFENIFMNAVDYNKNEVVHVEVSVSSVREGNKHFSKIEIKDNAIGIKDKRKKEILQEKHEKSKNSKGMGLGLSLVAKLIDLYGGRMWIEDRIKGDHTKGSNFVLLIPKAITIGMDHGTYQLV